MSQKVLVPCMSLRNIDIKFEFMKTWEDIRFTLPQKEKGDRKEWESVQKHLWTLMPWATGQCNSSLCWGKKKNGKKSWRAPSTWTGCRQCLQPKLSHLPRCTKPLDVTWENCWFKEMTAWEAGRSYSSHAGFHKRLMGVIRPNATGIWRRGLGTFRGAQLCKANST